MRTSFVEQSAKVTKWIRSVPITENGLLKNYDTSIKECRWYIIGKYCEMGKYTRNNKETVHELLTRLGQDIGCSEPTIRRFVSYAKAIDYLQLIVPDIVSELLSGQLRLSIENTRNFARRPHSEMNKIVERIKSGKERTYEIFPERIVSTLKFPETSRNNITVKDTPKYDPDAQIAGLSYTIPSWISAIERVITSDTLHKVSKTSRNKLVKELTVLKDTIGLMMKILTEKSHKGRRV